MKLETEMREKALQITGKRHCQNTRCTAEYPENQMYTYFTGNGLKRYLCPPCGENRLRAKRAMQKQMRGTK